jgi:hypothetical protein
MASNALEGRGKPQVAQPEKTGKDKDKHRARGTGSDHHGPSLKSIVLSASQPYVGAGQTLQINIAATYGDGSKHDLQPNATNTTWTSSSAAVVTISNLGLVTGVSCGPTNIVATYNDANSKKKFTSPPLLVAKRPG